MTERPHVPAALRQRVTEQAQHRCGYCLSSTALTGMPMTIDHILPLASGGATIEHNLWLACRRCNEFKGAQTQATDPETNEQVPLFNPRTQLWPDHFRWSEDGTQVLGITPSGRATILALQMNHPIIVATRRLWVSVGWWPPSE
jgi:hypothetical protein